MTLAQLKRKTRDDARIKQQQQDKIKSLFQQLKCAEYDIIFILDEYDRMEAEMAEQLKTVIKQHDKTIAQLKADHLQELRKKDDSIVALSKKAALDC